MRRRWRGGGQSGVHTRLMAEGAWAQAGDQPVGGAARDATGAGGAGERDADARTGGTRAPGCFT